MENKVVLLIRHSFCDKKKNSSYGHCGYLVDYLKCKFRETYEIIHPFEYSEFKASHIKKHTLEKTYIIKETKNIELKNYALYIKDFLMSLYFSLWIVLKNKRKIDLLIGANPLNVSAGVVLKKLGIVKKTVFYVIDYTPARFNSQFLNFWYQYFCKFSAKYTDYIWNLTQRMANVWRKFGVKTEKNIVVPGGINFHIKKRRFFSDDNIRLVFFGHLVESKGIKLIIEAFAKLVNKSSRYRLIIIGGGDLEGYIKNRIHELNLENFIVFFGFLPEYEVALDIISECHIGLALYKPSNDNITVYADPLKIKEYLSCDIPVIMTKVPEIAEEIQREEAGIVIDYHEDALVEGVLRLMEKYGKYKMNVGKIRKKYKWDSLFERAISKVI